MLVDATTQTIEIKLAGAVSTTELPIILTYIDGEASNFFPKLQHSISNGTTEVTILDAPEERGKRMVKSMTIRNVDTATATVIVQLADGATNREIVKIALLVDETLQYTDATGFKVIDTDGNTKVGGGGGFAAPTGAVDLGDSSSEGSLGSHSRSDHQHAHTAPSGGYPLDVAAAEADGSATTPARSDHVHKNMDIGARVYSSEAAQNLADGVTKILAFNAERYDTDTIHDNSTNNSRLTATTAGKYSITATIQFASDANGGRQVGLILNGATLIALMSVNARADAATIIGIHTHYDLSATDYVEVRVLQDGVVGGLDVSVSGNFSPEFAMQKVG